ncbi:MAG: POTRA domain-containing protein, partial [Microcoleus sp.]
MRIPIIAFLTLAAVAGGELAARAIDPTVAPAEVEVREGTAEAQRAQRDEDEVSQIVRDLPASDELAVTGEVKSPSLKSSRHKDFTSVLQTAGTIATKPETAPINRNAQQLDGTRQISQAGNAEGVYVAEVKIRFVNSRGEAVDKKGNPIVGKISEDFIRGELKLKAGDNYSQQVVRLDLQQLQQLGLFEKVTVSTEEVGTDINVIYNVEERSARSFGASVTLSDDVGVDVPLSYTDRTFGTNAQRLSVELEPSLRGIQYDVQFVSPYVAADDRLGYSVRAFGDRKISEIFNKDINLQNGDRVRGLREGRIERG